MPKSSSSVLARAKVEIPEPRYRADMELHDRFQSFSAELLKLSLSGLAAFGIVIALLGDQKTPETLRGALGSNFFVALSGVALASFGLSAACALIHRFLASDGMYHHLRAIKLLILLEGAGDIVPLEDPERPRALEEVDEDEATRNKKFGDSELSLRGSAIFLVLGALSLGAAFMSLLV